MKRLLGFLLWTAVFCGLLLAGDQLLVRVPLQRPAALAAVRDFYVDFRERLLRLPFRPSHSALPAVRGSDPPAPPGSPVAAPPPRPAAAPPAAAKGLERPSQVPPPMRYVYVDATGTLQFADRLEAVPAAFRKDARPMEP